MPEVRMQKVSDSRIVEDYVKLKNLLKSRQMEAAYQYYRDKNMIENWRDHMFHAMLRSNYVVTAIMIDMVHELGNLSTEEFKVEISKLLHNRCIDFANRVKTYVDSGIYDRKYGRLKNIANVVEARLKMRTGSGVVNLKINHFNSGHK